MLAESRCASSTTAESVAGSSSLKSGGTFELLIRSASGSGHLAEYGSQNKSRYPNHFSDGTLLEQSFVIIRRGSGVRQRCRFL